tara:strand:- start:18635 stop:19021 length:387 start_codon:yes stop_codon:yes gene_type:complete
MAQFKLSVANDYECVDFTCGHEVAMLSYMVARRREDKAAMWCPYCGVKNYFTGDTEKEKLRKQIDAERRGRQFAEERAKRLDHQRRGEKAAKTRIKNRIANGVCPCCNRTFQNLARHMSSQHPDYKES